MVTPSKWVLTPLHKTHYGNTFACCDTLTFLWEEAKLTSPRSILHTKKQSQELGEWLRVTNGLDLAKSR